jgi:hypothetical protein
MPATAPRNRARSASRPEPRTSLTQAQELEQMEAYVAQITKSKADSVAFLKRAGLLDKKGNLAKPYRT